MAKTITRGNQEMKVTSLNFQVKQVGEPEERILRFIGSDETPDRDGDVISIDGWELGNYLKNPVFLWAHDYSIPPVGKAIDVFIKNGKLIFDIQFPEKGIYPFADLVYNLYKGGFLNATSVGFIGKEYEERDDEAVNDTPAWRRGVKFTRQELLELSAVPVPSNPSALQQAKSLGAVTDDEYQSLMSFINGEFVMNPHVGVKTMKGIKSVYENQSHDDKKEVEEVGKETQVQSQETQVEQEKSTQELELDFVINPSTKATLLIDKKSGKILGDVTESIKTLISQAVQAVKENSEVHEKAGAVLSKKNKSRLQQARDLIIEVLEQCEAENSEGTDEEKNTPTPLEDEEEPVKPSDVSMDSDEKDDNKKESNGETTEEKSVEEVELEIEDEDDSIEIDGGDVDIKDFIKSTVASLLK
jgi:uncharacterized protein